MKNKYKNYDELPLVLNAQAISDVLGISRTNAYVLFNKADFPTIKIGARKMVARDKFIEWIGNASKKIN
ncbi:MAG: helix-turn-helix domain-containing protein [Clostridia bacterium]|jgi:predicted DNA-binding transcriptional regulator AlpA|nr:helix-turn-helix domain-containing protein [Clostridia bacterium]